MAYCAPPSPLKQKVYKMSQIEFCKIWVLEKLQDELSSGILISRPSPDLDSSSGGPSPSKRRKKSSVLSTFPILYFLTLP